MATQQALIELPTSVLLDKFGAGSHKPGSGSAAALMGLLSAKLVVTVASLSVQRLGYRKDHAKIQFAIDSIEQQLEPRLKNLFEHDAVVFDKVIKSRMARDNITDEKEKRRLAHMALENLKEATDIPFDICGICFQLIDYGIAMFDMGFKAARGDTGAAISAAVAGAMACIFVINLNLQSFRGSEWAKERRKRCDELHKVLETKQLAAFERVMTLREEDVASISLPFSEQP